MPYDVTHEFTGITEQGFLKWKNPYAKELSLKFYLESVEIFSETLPDLLEDYNQDTIPPNIVQAISETETKPSFVSFDNDNDKILYLRS